MSKQSHCLYDLLWRVQAKELQAEVGMIISNHETLAPIAEQFDIPFHYIPITKENKQQQEEKQLEILKEAGIELVILAKYMQILSSNFVAQFPQVINIHHSFLPAFIGAKPYHQAYRRGVKIIGASKAGIVGTIGPLATIIFSNLLLDEPLSWLHFVGLILVILGMRQLRND